MQRPKSWLFTPQQAQSSRNPVALWIRFCPKVVVTWKLARFPTLAAATTRATLTLVTMTMTTAAMLTRPQRDPSLPFTTVKRCRPNSYWPSRSLMVVDAWGRHHQKRNPMTTFQLQKVVGRAEMKNIFNDRNRGNNYHYRYRRLGSLFSKKTDQHRPSSQRRPKKPKQSPSASPPPP